MLDFDGLTAAKVNDSLLLSINMLQSFLVGCEIVRSLLKSPESGMLMIKSL